MTVIKYSYYLTLPDDEKVTEIIYEQPHVFLYWNSDTWKWHWCLVKFDVSLLTLHVTSMSETLHSLEYPLNISVHNNVD